MREVYEAHEAIRKGGAVCGQRAARGTRNEELKSGKKREEDVLIRDPNSRRSRRQGGRCKAGPLWLVADEGRLFEWG